MTSMDDYANASKINPASIEGKRLAKLPWYKKLAPSRDTVNTAIILGGVCALVWLAWRYVNERPEPQVATPPVIAQPVAEEPDVTPPAPEEVEVSVEIREGQTAAIKQIKASLNRQAIVLAMIKGHYEAIKTNPNRTLMIRIGGKKLIPVKKWLKDNNLRLD